MGCSPRLPTTFLQPQRQSQQPQQQPQQLLPRRVSAVAHSFSSSSSSSSPSIFSSPLEWWRDRQEQKEEEKYRERVAYMSNKDRWTIQDMKSELDEVVTSWRTKYVPGVSDQKEIKVATQMHKTVSSLIQVLGSDASHEDLDAMTYKQKLQAAVLGETTVEDLNMLIQQFQTMALMHRVLRKRKLEHKALPSSAQGLQLLMQTEGRTLLSKTQKERLKDNQLRSMRRGGGSSGKRRR